MDGHGRIRRLISQRLLHENRRLKALENGTQTLDARPLFAGPGVQERETHLAILVEIGIEPGSSIVREIGEGGRRKGIIIGKAHFETEGTSIVRCSLRAANHCPSMGYIGLILYPEQTGIREIEESFHIDCNSSYC
jgi:hypothetical protein